MLDKKSIHARRTIRPSQSTRVLQEEVLKLFREKYDGGDVRNLGVSYDNLVDQSSTIFDFFDDVKAIEREESLDRTIDEIRDRFGFTSLQRATSLMEGSRVIERSKLIGGHCGGMDGLE